MELNAMRKFKEDEMKIRTFKQVVKEAPKVCPYCGEPLTWLESRTMYIANKGDCGITDFPRKHGIHSIETKRKCGFLGFNPSYHSCSFDDEGVDDMWCTKAHGD
jgi:hypothetical protein